ncbi:MAG TPA: hypothetical protein VIM47_07720 [Dermatophilaceae bacterium]
MKIYLDPARYQAAAASLVANPVMPYVDGVRGTIQSNDPATGFPLWSMDVQLNDGTSLSVVRVKFQNQGTPAAFALGSPVTVTGLAASVVKENVYYAAEKITPSKAAA